MCVRHWTMQKPEGTEKAKDYTNSPQPRLTGCSLALNIYYIDNGDF